MCFSHPHTWQQWQSGWKEKIRRHFWPIQGRGGVFWGCRKDLCQAMEDIAVAQQECR